MKKNKKRILLIAILLIAAILGAAIGIYAKATSPIYIYECSPLEAQTYVYMAKALQSEEFLEKLQKEVKPIKRLSKEGASFGNILAAITVRETLFYPMDGEEITALLSDFYNAEQDLFAVSKELIDNVVLNFSASCIILAEYPAILENEQFSLREGILRNAAEVEFLYPGTGKSLYNSGGAVVDALYHLSEIDGVDYSYLLPENVEEWYQAWVEYYETEEDSYGSIAQMAILLRRDGAVEYLQSQYNTLTAEDGAEMGYYDFTTFSSFVPFLDLDQNPAFRDAMEQKLTKIVENFVFFEDIDI